MAETKVVYLSHGEPPREVIDPILAEIDVKLAAATIERDEVAVIAACRNADGIICQGGGKFTRRVLAGLPHCRVIARTGVGVDGIDLDFATEHGILICNTPGGNSREVADQTIGLMINITRKLFKVHEFVQSGQWRSQGAQAIRGTVHRLDGRTMGIIGLGSIGKRVAQRAQAFGLHVIAYDPYIPAESAGAMGVEFITDRDELFRRAHIVTIHAPLTEETRRSVGAREFALMPEGSYVINAARGGIMDHDALLGALRSGHLDGAGLDVTDPEPLPPDSPFLETDNVIITAHTASNSEEGGLENCAAATQCVVDVLQGRMPASPVNPEGFRPPAAVG